MINYVEVKKLFNIEKGSLQSSKCIEGEYDFITASSEWKKHKEYTHDTEALIVAVAASGSLGRVHYVNGKFIASDLCFILTPRSQDFPIDLSFYYYIFKSIRDDLVKSTATGTSKLAINKSNFGDYKIPYVDITKQKEYKRKLIHVAERKEKLSNINEEQSTFIKNLRRQILQDAISGKLTEKWRKKNLNLEPAIFLLEKIRVQKEKWIKDRKTKGQKQLQAMEGDGGIFQLPHGWVWCRLVDLCKDVPKNGYSPKAVEFKTSVKSLKLTATTSGKFDPREFKYIDEVIKEGSHLWLKNNDILIQRANSFDYVGTSAIYHGGDREFIYPDLMMKIQIMDEIAVEYIDFVLKANVTRKYFQKMATGTQKSMPKINQETVMNTPIPLPPLKEQLFIISKINNLMEKTNRIEILNLQREFQIESLSESLLNDN